jgi:CheY-like chemotaxis protein
LQFNTLEPSAGRAVVVDNNPANLYYASKVLRNRGYDAVSVSDMYAALKALEDAKTDILLTDIRLTGANGIDLARMAIQRYEGLCVLLMTAYREEELRAQHLIMPVIRVPFAGRQLLNRVNSLRLTR